jgi:branched-chain amino acid transport system ATP-binding protein
MKRVGQVALVVEDVHLAFRGVQALHGVSLDLKAGELVSLIGPNGSGKTSLLNCITGFYRPQKGKILWLGEEITNLSPWEIAARGVIRTFQNIGLLNELTVLDNLMTARHLFMRENILAASLYYGWVSRKEAQHKEKVEEILGFLGIEELCDRIAGTLSYGERKLVAIGRALALEPKVLLLDEPMAGMTTKEKAEIANIIRDICDRQGIPTALVEHDMEIVMGISDRIVVLDCGEKIAHGPPAEIKNNARVISAYLGEELGTARKNAT